MPFAIANLHKGDVKALGDMVIGFVKAGMDVVRNSVRL